MLPSLDQLGGYFTSIPACGLEQYLFISPQVNSWLEKEFMYPPDNISSPSSSASFHVAYLSLRTSLPLVLKFEPSQKNTVCGVSLSHTHTYTLTYSHTHSHTHTLSLSLSDTHNTHTHITHHTCTHSSP